VGDLARAATQPAERVRSKSPAGAPLHIVLVEPEIPPNTGNVARLCAATGCALHLVEPLGFSIADRELKRAGLDYWDALDVVVHPSLDDFLENWRGPLWFASTRGSVRHDAAAYESGDALLFGKETAGLPQRLIAANADRTLRVPMRPGAVRSINLSVAVGIVAYAALARIGYPGMR
jgi:tRNA (cytidine/uridine-2'-O-)-methyltransferase